MKKDRILVLDIDGTLSDSVGLHQSAFLAAMTALGLPDLDTDWGSYPHHTDTGILAHALAAGGRAQMLPHEQALFEQDLDQHFVSRLSERGLVEIRGARAFVEAAGNTGWAVVYATGGIRSVSRRKLQAIGIAYAEPTLMTASEHASRTDLVAAAIERAKQYYGIAEPRDVDSVGDGRWDLEVAGRLGIGFIGVGSPPAADVLTSRGATVFPDLARAMPWLQGGGGPVSSALPRA
ncbi:haloacid dehalogenase-like hydrolase [Cupriavidus basilensis]|uniref:Haloacid dehalogenase-like hydrolase n=1 Tax=Cupriavidus basilensis TaxID=68895 RepID=A0ABT6AHQ8_9BURK|nr:haloacid dehalogenase-like hydrolase [Cupriavidus basilensis]MDF3832135.1 haloacid dehalogenase-like hydrolase [Cupriavidus basilensis]